MDIQLITAVIAVLVICGLAVYAGMLISRIKRQKHLIAEHAVQHGKQVAEKKQQRNDNICHSIRFIARATSQKQCNVSEAAIRLTVLIETLLIEKPIDMQKEYPALFAMFEKVKDMPTHEERKKVAGKKLKMLDMEREVFESKMETQILAETEKLQSFAI